MLWSFDLGFAAAANESLKPRSPIPITVECDFSLKESVLADVWGSAVGGQWKEGRKCITRGGPIEEHTGTVPTYKWPAIYATDIYQAQSVRTPYKPPGPHGSHETNKVDGNQINE
jgi:hypothetical protein